MKGKTLRLSAAMIAAGVLAFALISYFGARSARAGEKTYVCKIGSVAPATSAWAKVAKNFQSQLEKKTSGRLKIELFLGGQLGTEASMLQMVQMGTIQGAAVTVSAVAKIVPEMNIYELPFLFHDIEEARTITDYVIYPNLNEKVKEKKMMGTAMFENGFRDFITKKFITTPADMKGLKFASEESQIHMAFWKSLGAAVVPKPPTEMFVTLTRGVADGTDNSILAIYALNLYTKTKKVTESEHIYQAAMVVVNLNWWNSLPDDIRKTLLDENMKMCKEMREVSYAEINNVKRGLGASGVKFRRLTDEEKAPFIEKTKPVYDEFEGVVGKKLLKQVLDSRATYRKMKADGKDTKEIIEKIRVKK